MKFMIYLFHRDEGFPKAQAGMEKHYVATERGIKYRLESGAYKPYTDN